MVKSDKFNFSKVKMLLKPMQTFYFSKTLFVFIH